LAGYNTPLASTPDMTNTRDRKKAPRETGATTNGSSTIQKASQPTKMTEKDREVIKAERGALVIWYSPIRTLYYFLLETLALTRELIVGLWRRKLSVLLFLISCLSLYALYKLEGSHQQYVSVIQRQVLWCSYWVGLGILSSVGLGTGLHTFLLYLGPHIAAVTLAAFECMSVDFPQPPYPDDIICPEEEGTSMTIWTIMSKVRLEAAMWGAGTAIGELPPYFMARAARLSGQIDEEEEELEELLKEKEAGSADLKSRRLRKGVLDRAKIWVHDLVQRVGFLGILLCASIPNPLFDLAGITCGHFLVPFWTFFGATLIGKAIIKMHIQKLFVIFTFSEHHVEQVIHLIGTIPYYGKSLQTPFKEYLHKQKAKLHVKPGTEQSQDTPSWLSWAFEKLVLVMVVYFVVSIVNSMAQNYHKRLCQKDKENKD